MLSLCYLSQLMSTIQMNNLVRFNLEIKFANLEHAHKFIAFVQTFSNACKELIISLHNVSLGEKN